MSDIIEVVQGDDLPAINITLKDSKSGERGDPDTWDPIDLSGGSTVTSINLRLRGGDGTILGVASTIKVGDGSDGELQMSWPAGFLDNDPGNYEGEVETSYAGNIQTVPEKLKIRILPQF